MGSWRPLVVPEEAAELLSLATSIGDALAGLATDEWEASLAGGHAGVALLYGWLAAATGRPEDATRARHHRDQAIAKLAEAPMDGTLWDGFVGVAFAVEMVGRLVEPGRDDRNEDIDAVLEEMLARPALWPLPHDLVLGVTGPALYAVGRLPRAGAHRSLELVLDRLESAADKDDDGLYWWTPADQMDDEELARDYPSGYGDLGVAHGVPGAIGLLGLMVGAGVGGARAERLLDGAVRWLWAQALPEPDGPTFPVWTAADDGPEEFRGPARSAWCYGDPGVAAALMLAARGAGKPEWERQATALALRAARLPTDETGVEYGGFCHGSAGLAHVYHRLYRATGEEELRKAARCWLADTVARCQAARGGTATPDGGPWVLGGEGAGSWFGADVVDGAAGVGLVLLAAATAVEPAWDRMFVLS